MATDCVKHPPRRVCRANERRRTARLSRWCGNAATGRRRKRSKRERERRRKRGKVAGREMGRERACNRRLISRTSRDVSLRRWRTWLRCIEVLRGLVCRSFLYRTIAGSVLYIHDYDKCCDAILFKLIYERGYFSHDFIFLFLQELVFFYFYARV